MIRFRIALGSLTAAALALSFAAAPVDAHAKRKPKPAAAMPVVPVVAPTENPEQARVRLNAEQAATAKAQNDRNAANKAAYEAAVAAREAEIAANKAAYDAAMAKWKSDNAACLAGDMTKCSPPVPK